MLSGRTFRVGLPGLAVLLVLLPAGTGDGGRDVRAVSPGLLARCCVPVRDSPQRNVTVVLKQHDAQPRQAGPVLSGPPQRGSGDQAPPPAAATALQQAGERARPVAAAPSAGPPPPASRILLPLDDTAAPADAGDASTGGGGLDGRTFRSALAATALGALAGRTRPSLLLGDDAAGSLLGSTLDGFWGLGQQAAMRLIVEGKAPGRRQVAGDAARIVAAAANREVASLMDDATRYGEDNGIRFLRNLEVMAEWYPGSRPVIEARTIDTLFESEALSHTLFLQASVQSDFADTTANIGLGYRYMLPGSGWMLGINAFYDAQFPVGHERMSIGLEASHGDFTMFGNRYLALSGWTEESARFEERPLSGWDAGIAGELPGLEDLTVSLAAFHWEREAARDRTGLRLAADYDVSPALSLGATVAADDTGDVRAGFRLTFQFGAAGSGGDDAQPAPPRPHRLDFVNRDNRIHTEKREVPRDYDVQFLASAVDQSNQSALGVVLTGTPASARYSYEITSSGGGSPVTGSGLIEGDPQTVSGIDVSGLPDGTLTLALRVISRDGAAGPRITTQIVKATAGLGVSTTTSAPSPTNASPISFTISFSQPVSGFDLADLAVANGTAANLRTSDNATWTVDVTPAGQGDVTLQVAAGAAIAANGAANPASNTTRVTYDSDGPSGYSVAFLASPIASSAFEIRDGEAGSTFSFTISSSAGGTPVSGSGAITSSRQQVSGLDLTGLADGTLTLSVTLSDGLGNSGAPATDTRAKDATGPVILAIIPPAAGDYDDL
jgi:hypothetical protein